jgi:hypothetical protein
MQAGHIGSDRLPQLGNAEVVRVERLAGIERVDAGLPDERRSDLVGLAEPEGQHVVALHAGVGDFADFGGAKAANGFARVQWVMGHGESG